MTSTPTPLHLRHIAPEKYIFYTHLASPFTQRVHITLNHLHVPYEAVVIDLKKPREEWYLEVNPVRARLKRFEGFFFFWFLGLNPPPGLIFRLMDKMLRLMDDAYKGGVLSY